jgi:hypothetical protein
MNRATAAGKSVSETDEVKNALKSGTKMPVFKLKDENGKTVESDDLLK